MRLKIAIRRLTRTRNPNSWNGQSRYLQSCRKFDSVHAHSNWKINILISILMVWRWFVDGQSGLIGIFIWEGKSTLQVKAELESNERVKKCSFLLKEWSPVRFVIIRVINKIGRLRSGSTICLFRSTIKDRIGRQGVLLLINNIDNKIWKEKLKT